MITHWSRVRGTWARLVRNHQRGSFGSGEMKDGRRRGRPRVAGGAGRGGWTRGRRVSPRPRRRGRGCPAGFRPRPAAVPRPVRGARSAGSRAPRRWGDRHRMRGAPRGAVGRQARHVAVDDGHEIDARGAAAEPAGRPVELPALRQRPAGKPSRCAIRSRSLTDLLAQVLALGRRSAVPVPGRPDAERAGRSLRGRPTGDRRCRVQGTDQIRAEIHGNAARPEPSGAHEAVAGGPGHR